jgi:hypothetical protein
MSRVDRILPAGFETLEPFVAAWAVEGAANRARRRDESSSAEREAFFGAAKGLLAPALEQLDRKPLRELDEAERRLMDLMLCLAHVSLAIEVQGETEARHRDSRRWLEITRASADGADTGR